MAEILVEGGRLLERCFVTVDASVKIALLHQLSEEFHVGSFSCAHDGRPYGDAVRFHAPKDVIHDLLNGASRHLFPARWAVWFPDSRPKQTKVVLDFGDRCHG